jgi:predicted NBD/HSP70 family sugar kinase
MVQNAQNPELQNGAARRERRGHNSGSTQSGVRLYNERLVLSLIRSHGALPKAEIARLTKLSPQTVSVIVRQLEADNLLLKGESLRGKVGQPLQPFSLNPDGVFSIGLKVGRRSSDILAIDFTGVRRVRHSEVYDYPTPEEVIDIAKRGLAHITESLGPLAARRICGIGIAAPFELWNWEQEVGAAPQAMERWRGVDIAEEIRAIAPWPVHFCNDATAACGAELFFGAGRNYRDFISFYVGFFVGGGVVLNGRLFQGRTGYSGAVGAMPVPAKGGTEQLIRHASTYVLERMVKAEGRDPLMLTRNLHDWSDVGPALNTWISETANYLAIASLASVSIIDFEVVIIDGMMPDDVKVRLIAETKSAFAKLDARGTAPVDIIAGAIGKDARAMGAASLPLFANFMADQDILFKTG